MLFCRYLKEMANVRKRENQLRLVNAAAKAAAKNPVIGRVSPAGFPKYAVKRLLHNIPATMAVPKLFEQPQEDDDGIDSSPENPSSPIMMQCLNRKASPALRRVEYGTGTKVKSQGSHSAESPTNDSAVMHDYHDDHEPSCSEQQKSINPIVVQEERLLMVNEQNNRHVDCYAKQIKLTYKHCEYRQQNLRISSV